MIVKIFKNKGKGNPTASINYLLGKKRDRYLAKVLKGNPELSLELANTLLFKNKYTVGCLSFEESNINENNKIDIIRSFEETIFSGLDSSQYDISWIEHRDKKRLELNFFIPNVELSTQKRFQPYYDRSDRILVDSWIKIINDQYQLSDPHSPSKKQLTKINLNQSISHSIIKKQINELILEGIQQNIITSRDDILSFLKDSQFEIVRITDNSISIKHELLNKNIRLTGAVYENREFDEKYAEQFAKETTNYRLHNRERIEQAKANYNSALAKRTKFNERTYKYTEKTTIQAINYRNNNGMHNNSTFHFNNIEHLSNSPNNKPTEKVIQLSANNKRIKESTISKHPIVTESQCVSTPINRIKRENFQNDGWNVGFRSLQKIGIQYAKRIRNIFKEIIDRVRTTYTTIKKTEQFINNINITINDTKQRIISTQRRINETKYESHEKTENFRHLKKKLKP